MHRLLASIYLISRFDSLKLNMPLDHPLDFESYVRFIAVRSVGVSVYGRAWT